MTWAEIGKYMIFWGPGAIIAGLIIFALYKLALRFGGEFIETQKRQAEALGAQAQAMTNLTKSIEGYMSRDNAEHKEMLIMLKLIWEKTEKKEMENGPSA
jgi:hypothetical protein